MAQARPRSRPTQQPSPEFARQVWNQGKFAQDPARTDERVPRPLSVIRAKIAPLAVGTNELGDLQVTQPKMASGSVGTPELIGLSILSGKIADLQVTEPKIAPLSVIRAKIAQFAVGTEEIGANQVLRSKVAPVAIGSDEIDGLSVLTGKLAENAVTEPKISPGSVTQAKLNLADPKQPSHAATQGCTNDTKVSKNGSTMSASLEFDASGKGPIVRSPNGTRHRLHVTDAVAVVAISPP